MNETIQRQIMTLKVFCYNGKKYLEGWALSAMGINIPMDQRNNHFEYTQEKIDILISRYMEYSPSVKINIEEDYSYDTQQTKHNSK